MIRDLAVGQYFPANSVLHRTDARVKILNLLITIIFIFYTMNYFSLFIALIYVFLMMYLSNIPMKLYMKNFKIILFFTIFTGLLNLFDDRGKVIFEFGFLKITDAGINNSIFVCSRVTSLVILASIFTFTTLPTDLTDAVEKLLKPFAFININISEIAMMMTIAIRFIPTLIEEVEKIINAQKSRGADFENKNLFVKIRALMSIVVPLLESSFKRAYDLATAMESRCYRGAENRTRMRILKFKMIDLFSIFLTLIFIFGVVYCNMKFPATVK